MTRHNRCSSSTIYCLFVLFVGQLKFVASFLPSSKASLLQHDEEVSSWFIQQQQTKISTTSLPQAQSANNQNKNNQSTYKYNKGKSRNNKNKSISPNNSHNFNSKFNKHKLLNYEIIQCNNAPDLLTILGEHSNCALSKAGGGGAFDDINFATAFSRFAKLLYQKPKQTIIMSPSQILSNANFALLLCSTAEVLSNLDGHSISFKPRQLSNIVWSIAKLKIAPSRKEYPIEVSSRAFSKSVQRCSVLRNKINHATNNNNQVSNEVDSTIAPWVPELSKLCGNIVDMISYKAMKVDDPTAFQIQEYSNMLWAVATIERSDFKMMAKMVDKLIQLADMYIETNSGDELKNKQQKKQKLQKEELKLQAFSNSLWSLATTSTFGPDEHLLQFTAKLILSHPSFLENSNSQCISNIAWSTGSLLSKRPSPASEETNIAASTIMRCTCQEIIKRQGETFKPQAISNVAWALATVGFGVEPIVTNKKSENDAIYWLRGEPTADYELMSDAVRNLVVQANQGLHCFHSQALCNMAWAMARLGQNDEMFLKRLGWEIANTKTNVQPQALSMTLWALAKLEIYDKDLYKIIASRFVRDKSSRIFSSQVVSNILWALAKSDLGPQNPKAFETTLVPRNKHKKSPQKVFDDPITACFALGAQDLASKTNQYGSQEISTVLWSFVKVGVRHPRLFRSVAIHLVGCESSQNRVLKQFLPQEISNLAWAFAKHAQIGSVGHSAGATSLHAKLTVYKLSAVDIGEALLQRLFTAISLCFHKNLHAFAPQELTISVWSFALLGFKNDAYLDQVQVQISDRVKSYLHGSHKNKLTTSIPLEITNFIWGFAKLSKPLIPGLMDDLSIYLAEQCKDPVTGDVTLSSITEKFDRQLLGTLAWGCAVHNQYPPEIIKIIYMGLLGVGCDKPLEPAYLAKSIYKDTGIDDRVIQSLLYLQLAMDLDGKNTETVSLPKNFPQAWVKSSNDKKHYNTNDAGERRKISSKTQQGISAALDRIGFDHVEEYVMDMNIIVNDYGIDGMTSSPFEILSIDIANVNEKIAIEVHGPSHFLASLNNIDMVVNKTIENENSSNNNDYDLQTASVSGSLEDDLAHWNRNELDGGTLLKHRILEKLGWKVKSIRVWDWYKLNNGDSKKEEDFCRLLLDEQ